jgi:hypothetical protein
MKLLIILSEKIILEVHQEAEVTLDEIIQEKMLIHKNQMIIYNM